MNNTARRNTKPRLPKGVVSRTKLNDGLIRYRLANGWFIDYALTIGHRSHGYKCGIWIPGAGERGTAGFFAGADSLRDVLKKVPDAT